MFAHDRCGTYNVLCRSTYKYSIKLAIGNAVKYLQANKIQRCEN